MRYWRRSSHDFTSDTNAAIPDGNLTSEPVPKLGPPVKKVWAKKWKKELKLAQRQYDRLIEMMILRALDPKDEKIQRAFRLQVKARLKVFNFVCTLLIPNPHQD
jgi:histone acetyltransferase 1